MYTLAPRHQYSSYAFEFTASRNVEHYLLKVILPLVLIVISSWAVFWIDPINASSQVSIAMTSMLTLIAYRFAIDIQLPRLPYMTRLDIFILANIARFLFPPRGCGDHHLDNTQKKKRAVRIDRYCRVIFTAVFGIASIATFAHPRD